MVDKIDRFLLAAVLVLWMPWAVLAQGIVRIPGPGGLSSTSSPPAFVNGGTNPDGGNAFCDVTLSVTAGNTVVVTETLDSTATTISSVTDTDSDSFTTQYGNVNDSGNFTTMFVATTDLGTTNAAEDFHFTYSNGTENGNCFAEQYSGAASVSVVDQKAIASNIGVASGSPQTTGTTATTTHAADMLVAIFGAVGPCGDTYTAGSGYTIRHSSTQCAVGNNVIEDKSVTATGAYSATVTLNGDTANGSGVILALKGM